MSWKNFINKIKGPGWIWDKRVNFLVGMVALGIVYMLIQPWLMGNLPFLTVVISLALFMLPGGALALYLLPEENWIERIPLAMALSGAILSPAGILVLGAHLSMHFFLITSAITTLVLILLIVYFMGRRLAGEKSGDVPKVSLLARDKIPLLIIVLLTIGIAAICIISAKMPLIGDDWVAMPWFWEFRVAPQVNLYSPYHGIDLPTTVRQEFAVLALMISGINELSGIEPIPFYLWLRPLMTILGMLAFFGFMRTMLRNRRGAAIATTVFVVIIVGNLIVGSGGYDLVVRILQDKFFLRFVLLPLALRFLIDYFQTKETRYIVLFGLIAWTSGTTHPIGPALIALPSASFGAFHLFWTLVDREKRKEFWKTFGRLVLTGSLLIVSMALPAMQLLGAEAGWVSFSLEGSIIDPNYLARIRLATRAYRLMLLDNGGFTLHPAIILDPLKILAILCLPILIFRMRKHIPSRLLFATYIILVPLLYIPKTARLLGEVVTPWLLWRFAWALDIVAWAIITGLFFIIIEWFVVRLKRFAPHAQTLLPAIGIFGLMLGFVPTIKDSYGFAYNLMINPDQAGCLAPGAAIERLATRLTTNTVVLSDQNEDFCIPAFSAWTNVIEYRGVSTLTRFPVERRDEAWQRLMDSEFLMSARYVDESFNTIIDRYHAEYLFFAKDRFINLYLAHMPSWFTPVDQAGGYSLYSITGNRQTNFIIQASSAMSTGDWKLAENLFTEASKGSGDDHYLGLIGLAQTSLFQGQIKDAIKYMRMANDLHPEEAIGHAMLADMIMADGDPLAAIPEYELSESLMPDVGSLKFKLADAYRLLGRNDEARQMYIKSVLTRVPADSSLYYMLLGQAYQHAGWNADAIESYQKVIELTPVLLEPRVAIGGVYLTEGALDQAYQAYVDAYNTSIWNSSPRLGLGQVAAQRGETALALDYYLQSIRLDPATNMGYNLYTSEYSDEHSTSETIQAIKNLIGYKLSMPGALTSLADLYVATNRLNDAIALYNQVIAADPLSVANYLTDIASNYNLSGNYNEAIDEYRKAQSLGEVNIAAYTGLGSVFQSRILLNQAMGQYFGALLLDPFSASSHVTLGNGYKTMYADWPKAIQEYEMAIKAEPISPMGYLSLAQAYADLGRFEESITTYEQAIAMNPNISDGYLGLASVYTKMGNSDLARSTLEEVAKLVPDLNKPSAAAVWAAFGQYYFSQSDYASSIEYYNKSINAKPDESSSYLSESDVLLDQGDTVGAIKLLEEGIKNTTADISLYIKLYQIELIQGNADVALTWLETGTSAITDPGIGYIQIAAEYQRRGDLNRAIQTYQKALEVQPNLADGYNGLASLYKTLGQNDQAEKTYKAGLAANHYSNSMLLGLGNLYMQEGRLKDADLTFQQAMLLMPTANGFQSLSNVRKITEGWESAEQTLLDGLKARPGLIDSYTNLGYFYIQWGNLQKAKDKFQQALGVAPLDPGGYQGLSQVYQNEGDQTSALNILLDGIKINPNSSTMHQNLASYYENQGNSQKAEEQFLKALALSPNNNSVYVTVGQFYQRQKRYNDALNILKQALSIPPNNAALYNAIANANISLNQVDEGKKWYIGGISLDYNNVSSYQALATFYQSQEKWDDALNALNSALTIQPNNVQTRLSLGNLYYRLTRFDEAKAQFETVCALDSIQVDCHLALAKWYQRFSNWEMAVNQLEIAIKDTPTNLAIYTQLGQLYSISGDSINAEKAFTRGVFNSYDKPSALLARGSFYNSIGSWDKAQADYESAWQINPNSQAVGAQLASFYQQRGDWQRGLTILEELSQQSDKTAANLTTLANMYANRAMWDYAISSYEEAIDVDKTYVNAYTGLTNTYRLMKRPENSNQIIQLLTIAAPDDPVAWITQGDAFLADLDFENAEIAYNKALQIAPVNTTAFIKLDNLSLKRGQGGIDLTPLVRRITAAPSSSMYDTLANQYQLHGDWENARIYLDKASNLDPNNSSVWIYWGNYYRILMDWNQAVTNYQKALQFQPYSATILQTLASSLYNQGQTESAITTINQAIEADHGIDASYSMLANFQLGSDLTDTAIQTLNTGLEADPTSISIYQSLSQIYVSQGDYEQALNISQLSLDLMPGSDSLIYNYGNVLENKITNTRGSLDTAESNLLWAEYRLNIAKDVAEKEHYKPWTIRNLRTKEKEYWAAQNLVEYYQSSYNRVGTQLDVVKLFYQEALQIQPDNIYALTGLGRLAVTQDQPDLALSYYEDAVVKNPTAISALNALGKYLVDINRPNDSLPQYKQSLIYSPNNPGALYGLTRANRAIGDVNAETSAQTIEYSQVWWAYYMDVIRP